MKIHTFLCMIIGEKNNADCCRVLELKHFVEILNKYCRLLTSVRSGANNDILQFCINIQMFEF